MKTNCIKLSQPIKLFAQLKSVLTPVERSYSALYLNLNGVNYFCWLLHHRGRFGTAPYKRRTDSG